MTDLPFIPDALQPYMPLIVESVTAIIIFVLGWMVAGWTHGLVAKLLRARKVDEAVVRFLASLAQWAVIAAVIITALARVGVETTSLVALLGTAGLAIGLALQGNLSHFASGVMMLLFRPLSIGDYVEVAGNKGTVEEIGLFATTLISPDNTKLIIANGSVTGNVIVNYTTLDKPRAAIKIAVAYGSKIPEVVRLLEAAAKSVPQVLAEPAPLIVFVDLGDSGMAFEVKVCSKPQHFIDMQNDVRRAVYEQLEQAKIEIPFPQVVVRKAA